MAKREVRKVKTRCAKCGAVATVHPSQRRCHALPMGRLGYWCYGALERVSAPPRQTPEKRPQDVAAAKLADARKRLATVTRRIRRLVTSQRLWERRVSYFARRASMTDAEVEAERVEAQRKKEARASRRIRRAVDVTGKEL